MSLFLSGTDLRVFKHCPQSDGVDLYRFFSWLQVSCTTGNEKYLNSTEVHEVESKHLQSPQESLLLAVWSMPLKGSAFPPPYYMLMFTPQELWASVAL